MNPSPKERVIHSAFDLGRALRDRRRERGLSQAQLADRSGVAQPTISNVERGLRGALDTILRLCAELELELVVQPRPHIDLSNVWEPKARG